MSLPNLPTDSLYKFAALGTLAAWLFILFGTWSQFERIQQRIYEQREAIAVLEVEVATLKQAIRAADAGSVAELQRESARLAAKHENTSSMLRIATFISSVGLVLSAALLLVCLWTFRLWYLRVQAPQDEVLQLQLQEARSKQGGQNAA